MEQEITDFLRETLTPEHGVRALVPLRRVIAEFNDRDRDYHLVWNLEDGRHFNLTFRTPPAWNGYIGEEQYELVRRTMIHAFRRLFIELTGNEEAYVPDPQYQYAIIEREPRIYNYGPGLAGDAEEMVMRTTRDPYHAGQRDRGPRAREEAEYERRREAWMQAQRYLQDPEVVCRMSNQELEALARGNAGGRPPDRQRDYFMAAAQRNVGPVDMMMGQQTNMAQQAPAFTLDMLRQAQAMLQRDAPVDADAVARAVAAEEKGWNLLLENLTPEQRNDLNRQGHFWVIGGTTGIHYKIGLGRSYNIWPHVAKKGWGRWSRTEQNCSICFAPNGGLCIGDVMLTQKVALELRESDALKAANFSGPLDWLKAANKELWHAVAKKHQARYGGNVYF